MTAALEFDGEPMVARIASSFATALSMAAIFQTPYKWMEPLTGKSDDNRDFRQSLRLQLDIIGLLKLSLCAAVTARCASGECTSLYCSVISPFSLSKVSYQLHIWKIGKRACLLRTCPGKSCMYEALL